MKTTIISEKQLQNEIAKRNKIFKAASPAQKRVLIAKDVLKMLKDKKIIARTSRWVNINTRDLTQEIETADSLQKLMLSNQITCDCCALGSVILSCVNFKNNISADDYYREALRFNRIWRGSVEDKLGIKKLFSATQLQMIEIAFEYGEGYFSDDYTCSLSRYIREKCIAFGDSKNNHDRLKAIMLNIVKNKGQFIP